MKGDIYMFENEYGEKFSVNDFYFDYNLTTTDRPTFDKVINPFDLFFYI